MANLFANRSHQVIPNPTNGSILISPTIATVDCRISNQEYFAAKGLCKHATNSMIANVGCQQENFQRNFDPKAFPQLYVSLSFLIFSCSSPRMVAISPCINAHGTAEPAKGHFSPLGQYTSLPFAAPWLFILSREQGKQNL